MGKCYVVGDRALHGLFTKVSQLLYIF